MRHDRLYDQVPDVKKELVGSSVMNSLSKELGYALALHHDDKITF
jgi:hypothetical protein